MGMDVSSMYGDETSPPLMAQSDFDAALLQLDLISIKQEAEHLLFDPPRIEQEMGHILPDLEIVRKAGRKLHSAPRLVRLARRENPAVISLKI